VRALKCPYGCVPCHLVETWQSDAFLELLEAVP
jgi:hypothetical protein